MINNNIRKLLKQKDMTIDDLASKLHYTRYAILAWTRNKTRPNLETLFEMERIFDCDIHDIYYDE